MVYGILDAILASVILFALKNTIINAITTRLPAGSTISAIAVYNLAIVLVIFVAIFGGIILGLVLGLIFGAVENHIPGKTGVIKGLIFGIVMWLLLSVLGGLPNLSTYGSTFYLAEIAVGLVISLLFGYLMGTLFDRGMRKFAPPAA